MSEDTKTNMHLGDRSPFLNSSTCNNTLAGQAATIGAVNLAPLHSTKDLLLPRECATVVVDGQKLTSDMSDELRHFLGKEAAHHSFTAPQRIRRETNIGGLGWTRAKFDSVDWAALCTGLAGKSEMYGVWLAKQTIGICATTIKHGVQGTWCPRNVRKKNCVNFLTLYLGYSYDCTCL